MKSSYQHGIAFQVILIFQLFIIGFLLPCKSLGQQNYLPGYILTLEGDTIEGFIDYKNWQRSPTKIYFKNDLEADHKQYNSFDISKFNVAEETYISAIVKSEYSSIDESSLKFDAYLNIKIDTTFLRVVILGPKSLYFHKNKGGNENFYISSDQGLLLLEYKKYLAKNNEQTVTRENKRYMGQLRVYLDDCNTIDSKINASVYHEKSLEKVFLSYYDCISEAPIYYKKSEKTKAEFGLLAGMSITSLQFTSSDDDFDYLTKAEYPVSIQVMGGIFLNLVLPRNNRKWSLYNELTYSSFSVTGYYEDIRSEDIWTKYYTEFAYSYLNLNVLLRYRFPVRRFFIFGNLGLSSGLVLSSTNSSIIVDKVYSNERTQEKTGMIDKNSEQRFLAGIGTQYGKFSLECRLELGNGISGGNGLGSSTFKTVFLLGFRF